MQRLPIDDHLDSIRAELARHGCLVLVAEPGAGKTTRLPPALVDGGLVGQDRVLVLEPRRVAARQAARRVAQERGDEVGGFAGFRVRLESRVSRATRVEFITEGILTRRLQRDPELAGVGAVVLDEFHERSLHADLALALLREVRRDLRSDLKLVVMSATLEAAPIARYLDDAPIVNVPGRLYPLTIEEQGQPDERSLEARVAGAVRRLLVEQAGDVLVFLPGVGEILRARAELEPLARERDLLLLPLYGDQSSEEQDRVFAPAGQRKVILATNVAETSLTVPGVGAVVDSGLARVLAHDAAVGLDRLERRPISRASAIQRAGRAGRMGPGRVLRLWTRAEAQRMPERDLPEIQRVDLTGCVLELAVWGVRDPARFPWFEAPEPQALARARELLVELGALDAHGAPTDIGRSLSELGTHPRLARVLVEAHRLGIPREGADIAALLSERDLLGGAKNRVRLATGPSDVLARLDLLHGRSREVEPRLLRAIERSAEEFDRVLERALGPAAEAQASDERLLRAIFAGFPDRVAARRAKGSNEAVMVGGRGLVLADESAVRDAELFVVVDADLGRRGSHSSARVRQASAIDRAWLDDVPGGIVRERVTRFDQASGRVVGVARTRFFDLVLEEGETGAPEPGRAQELLFEAALAEPARALDLAGEAGRVLQRLRSLAEWCPELGLPAHDEAALVRALEPWAEGCTSLADLCALPLVEVLRSRLTREQKLALDEHAPDALSLPSGSNRRLDYQPGQPPVLAVRLQELFGLAATPTVARGRVRVLLHLLAPNQRVVQVTQDLTSFWNTTYVQVRKDLRARYPKHSWPEDPWTAQPTARAKRRRS